jgi:hypothetical protein
MSSGGASYSYNVKVGKRGYAKAKSDYLARRGDYSDLAEERSSRGKKINQDVPDEELEACDSLNLPNWADNNDAYFWEYSDKKERKNGNSFREITLALPRDMTPVQRQELLHEFLDKRFGQRHVVSWAIHNCKAALDIEGGQNTHAHIMYSERILDGHERGVDQFFKRYNPNDVKKGGCKKYTPHQVGADVVGARSQMRIARKEDLKTQRKLWEVVQNRHLEKCGFEVRVSCETLKKQGIDREPERHLGWRGVRKSTEAKVIKEQRQLREAEEAADKKAQKAEERKAKALEAKLKKESYEASRAAEVTAKIAKADAEIKSAELHAKNGPFTPNTLSDGDKLIERFNRVVAEKSIALVAERAPQVKDIETRLTELQKLKNSWELSPPMPWQVKRREKEAKALDVEWRALQTEWKQLTKHISQEAEHSVLTDFPDYADALAIHQSLVVEAQARSDAAQRYLAKELAQMPIIFKHDEEVTNVESQKKQESEEADKVSVQSKSEPEKENPVEAKPVPFSQEEKPQLSRSKAPNKDDGGGPEMK